MKIDTSDVARKILQAGASDLELMLDHVAEKFGNVCESPIECMLLTSLLVFDAVYAAGSPIGGCRITVAPEAPAVPSADYAITIVPQFRWEQYRIDFAVFANSSKPAVFVECDGFLFHERTPDQASRDRQRDRLIQQKGIPIIRFLGREIHRDPFGCALQVIEFLGSRDR